MHDISEENINNKAGASTGSIDANGILIVPFHEAANFNKKNKS